MKDFLANELQIGDDVVYIEHSKNLSCYVKSRISHLTNKYVVMENKSRKLPVKVVKITNENNL